MKTSKHRKKERHTSNGCGVTIVMREYRYSEKKLEISSSGEETVAQPLVRVQEQKTIMKVLVAVDESEGSLYALQWALQNIPLHRQSTAAPVEEEEPPAITVVHVQLPFQQPYTANPVGPEHSSAEVLSRASELCKQHMVSRVFPVHLQQKHAPIKAETMVVRGNPKEMIVEATEQMNVDLLVVGSRGLGQIKRAFLGSVSDYCAHHATCPVLINPCRDQARDKTWDQFAAGFGSSQPAVFDVSGALIPVVRPYEYD
ncbi:hypothetical protein Ccrd_012153 [Cynara cardunculus var. scolymus]|uniref:UspA domain-containing protein n=1 Tax=Cynara cardunculus var. scolymus TaxID=59895 RepID=A0A118K5Q6_CYNCS|nr:hypothetical protein Ccrd_012153 [Cynara cardunculus var. scolymus]